MYILEFLLLVGTLFLVYKTLVLTRNRFDFRGLIPRSDYHSTQKVAICIPARNEEKSIKKCVLSAIEQTYPNIHVYVLNDRSTDQTAKILDQLKKKYPEKLTVLTGETKQDGWLGKPFACHTIAKDLNEEILLFVDADTWMEPHAVKSMVYEMEHRSLSFLTVWPQQHLFSFWENITVPLVYDALIGLLPTAYTERKPRWMPSFFYKQFKDRFAAACGQCMMFSNIAYNKIGGHASVKQEIVEDVQLARKIVQNNFQMKMYHGVRSFHCRMYTSYQEIFDGFRKNFFAGFDYNYLLFATMGVIHLLAYVLPVIILIGGLFLPIPLYVVIPAFLNVGLFVLHHVILATWFRWLPGFSFLKPIGVLWFQYLGIITVWDRLTGKKVNWKGDKV